MHTTVKIVDNRACTPTPFFADLPLGQWFLMDDDDRMMCDLLWCKVSETTAFSPDYGVEECHPGDITTPINEIRIEIVR